MIRWAWTIVILLAGGCAPTTRVMTWNVNWGGPGMDSAVQALRDARADVVCLQETTPAWEQKLRAELSGDYPHMLFKQHHFGAGGLAVLSRRPVRETAYVAPEGGWFPALVVLVETAAGDLQIAVVHLHPPQGKPGTSGEAYSVKAVRRGEIKSLLTHVETGRPTLILGDFNEDEQGLAIRHLTEQGYVNALTRFGRADPTWRVNTGSGDAQARVDHILMSPDLECVGAEVMNRGESDHLPVVGEFHWD